MVVHHLHAVMRAYIRLDYDECLDVFDLERGLLQGCMLAPFLVFPVTENSFFTDAAIMDSMAQLQRKKQRRGKRDEIRAGKIDGQEEEGVQTSCGMLCTDDAGIVSLAYGFLHLLACLYLPSEYQLCTTLTPAVIDPSSFFFFFFASFFYSFRFRFSFRFP